MKTFAKTETVEEFLARGGKVVICPPSEPKKHRAPQAETEEEQEEVDFSALPEALKIRYGIKA